MGRSFYCPGHGLRRNGYFDALATAGLQRIDVSGRRAGQWKMRLQWKADGQDYFLEETLVFAEPERGVNPAASIPAQ